MLLCLSGREMAPTRQRPLLKDTLGARMKNMWEEQLVDHPIAYITGSHKGTWAARFINVVFEGFATNPFEAMNLRTLAACHTLYLK